VCTSLRRTCRLARGCMEPLGRDAEGLGGRAGRRPRWKRYWLLDSRWERSKIIDYVILSYR
jgi:hypothetical protein